MKLNFSRRRNGAMTAVEVFVVIACVSVLAVVFIMILASQRGRMPAINCVERLKTVNLAFRIWAGDNEGRYPMTVSVTNGGAMELIETGDLVDCLEVVSNELGTTRILVCPNDPARTFATNWNALNGSHISYFFDADANSASESGKVFSGDNNLAIGGKAVTSGVVDLSSNAEVSWYGTRHGDCGNIGMADGSVLFDQSSAGLQQAIQRTGLATNQIAIP